MPCVGDRRNRENTLPMNELLVCRRVSATAKTENDPVSGLMRAWRQPLRRYRFPANAPFIGSSVTGRARLVAAAVSAHEARFDQATETNDSTNFDFLKEIVVGGAKQRRRFSGIRAETRAPSALPAPLCLREPPGSAVPPGCPIGPWGWQNRNARPAPG